MDRFDIAILGAGVVGLAIGRELTRHPRLRRCSIVLLEQEEEVGQHTSSRNSEVIHAGIYYPAGSLKAMLCVQGKPLLYEYCRQNRVACRQTGKLIVAREEEVAELESIGHSAAVNGVDDLQWLEKKDIRRLEPKLQSAAGLFSPSTGIIDSHAYMASLLAEAQAGGVLLARRTRVARIERRGEKYRVSCHYASSKTSSLSEPYQFDCGMFVNSAGLAAGEVARGIQSMPASRIPRQYLCKGDYFTYRGRPPFSHLVYPVPERNLAGLGIHATLDMTGQVRFGPDAEYVEAVDYRVDPGKARRFAAAICRYFPGIDPADLLPGYAGIRPKLSGPGEPAADFVLQGAATHGLTGLVNLFGIESPGLTASLAIAARVADMLADETA